MPCWTGFVVHYGPEGLEPCSCFARGPESQDSVRPPRAQKSLAFEGSKWRSKGSVPSEPRSTTQVRVVSASRLAASPQELRQGLSQATAQCSANAVLIVGQSCSQDSRELGGLGALCIGNQIHTALRAWNLLSSSDTCPKAAMVLLIGACLAGRGRGKRRRRCRAAPQRRSKLPGFGAPGHEPALESAQAWTSMATGRLTWMTGCRGLFFTESLIFGHSHLRFHRFFFK